MTDVKKIVVEKFDEEGNLVERITTTTETQTEPKPIDWSKYMWPYGVGTVYPPNELNKFIVTNGVA